MSESSSRLFEQDPRVQLSEMLHDFFLDAIMTQVEDDADWFEGIAKRPPEGSFYKVDAGFLKIHLQGPVPDVTFGEGRPKDVSLTSLLPDHIERPPRTDLGADPSIWLLIPLTDVDKDYYIIDEILAAENIIMRVQQNREDFPSVAYLVKPDGFRLIDEDATNAAALIEFPIGDELEDSDTEAQEQQLAHHWSEFLNRYKLRPITTTDINRAAS